MRLAIFAFPVFCLCPVVFSGCSSTPPPGDAERQAREAAFAESMRGVVLEGSFTIAGREAGKLRAERYEIEKVVKLGGDIWTFHARIQYGDHDVVFPVPVKLLWAGDTPMVSLTDVGIPGLGTFTARVLFYQDHYAGIWRHGEAGGSQFGRIVRPGE